MRKIRVFWGVKIMAKTTRWLLSSAAALMFVSSALQAQQYADLGGLYLEGGGGLSLIDDTNYTQFGAPFSFEHKEGYIVSGAVGIQWQNVHAEIEGLAFQNEYNLLSGFGANVPLSGETIVVSALANVYYDFDFGSYWRPFVGGGVGYAKVWVSDAGVSGVPLADDDERTLAYQLKAGISYSLGNHADLIIGYRYFHTGDLDFADVTGATFSSDGLVTHGVEARFRIRF